MENSKKISPNRKTVQTSLTKQNMMKQNISIMKRLVELQHALTPKGRILGKYILDNPRKAVFMTTKELAETCHVSEATVVRFVSQLGYEAYSVFQQSLRDFVDTELTMLDRTDLSGINKGPGTDRLSRVLYEEMDNLKQAIPFMSSAHAFLTPLRIIWDGL